MTGDLTNTVSIVGIILCGIVIFAGISADAYEQKTSWPQLQTSDNSSYTPSTIPEDISIIWEASFSGIARGGLVVAKGKAYVAGDSVVTCFDLHDGSVLWEHDVGADVMNTPSVFGDHVFVSDNAGTLHCIDTLSGEQVWEGQYTTDPGSYSDILIEDDSLFFCTHGTSSVVRIKPDNGDVIWRYDTTIQVLGYGKPILHEGALYVTTETDGVLCLDADTGEELWHHVSPEQRLGNFTGCPVFAGGMLCAGTINDVFGITPTGDTAWKFDTQDKEYKTVSTHDDIIYFGIYNGEYAGDLFSLDAATGEILWQSTLLYSSPSDFIETDRIISGIAPTVTPRSLLVSVRRKDGSGAIYIVDRGDGQIIDVVEGLKGSIREHIPVVDGRIYVSVRDGNNGHVYCLG
jgi:outer membrane protein assembly factor BamB